MSNDECAVSNELRPAWRNDSRLLLRAEGSALTARLTRFCTQKYLARILAASRTRIARAEHGIPVPCPRCSRPQIARFAAPDPTDGGREFAGVHASAPGMLWLETPTKAEAA